MLFPKFRSTEDLSDYQVWIDSVPINPTSHVRYLSVYFDDRLSWKPHLDTVVKKVSRKIGILRRHRGNLSVTAISAFARCVINPDLDYCSTIWSNGSPAISSRLCSLQKRSLRAIAGLRHWEQTGSTGRLLSLWNLPSINFRHMIQLGTLAFRCINGLASNMLCGRFDRCASDGHYSGLSNRGVSVSRSRTNALKKTSFYRGQVLWNSLPTDIRIINRDFCGLFKSCLRLHLLRVLYITAVMLKNDKIAENSPLNTIVGTFSTADPGNEKSVRQTFTYTLLDSAQGRFKFKMASSKWLCPMLAV
eukprot:m.218749 g.218749  ORF g.218749 m.218749 type:complete len:304 (+) comp39904_c0_seq11:649-1560(+)